MNGHKIRDKGNSKSGFTYNDSGVKVFRKEFALSRQYQFYNELYCSRYLHCLGQDLTTRVVAVNKRSLWIDYEPYSAPDNFAECRDSYLALVRQIHSLSNEQYKVPLITLHANQPLADVGLFLESFKLRIGKLQQDIAPVARDHITRIGQSFEVVSRDLKGASLYTPMMWSQADSGVHNCVINSDQKLLMADLEYAGLDSPIKQCIDYLLHPRCQREIGSHNEWWNYFSSDIFDRRDLKLIPSLAAALSLKWALITLNEFRPEIWDLRVGAKPERNAQKDDILDFQLAKSKIYYVKCQELLDGVLPYEIFRESERNQLSCTY